MEKISLIVGPAGSGKTAELEKRAREQSGACLFLYARQNSRGTTPYKLALEIVASVEKKVPEPDRVRAEGKKKSRFSSRSEYENRLLFGPPVSLCGEVMKSFGETEIANFLFASKIDYVYEHPYKIDTRTELRAQYRPDFYLPEHDIYIEYFALDRQGRAPSSFTLDYAEGEKWKKALHEENGTKLISLYAYERAEGNLIDELAARLKKENVKIKRRRRRELYPQKATFSATSYGADFSEIIKRATEYAKDARYTCPCSSVFVDDIDLMDAECLSLIAALSLPIFASARSEDVLRFFESAEVTRLEKKYRCPKYEFLPSYTGDGEIEQMIRYLESTSKGSQVLVIGKRGEDAKALVCPRFSLSYDRERGCVKVCLGTRSDLRIHYVSASVAEGWECEYAVVLSDTFGKDDRREFETALSRAKCSVCIISKVGEESLLSKEFRESLGIPKVKKGFSCPKCGAELVVAKGKYGYFLSCRACGHKKSM